MTLNERTISANELDALAQVETLYHAAFPKEERRPWSAFCDLLTKEERFSLIVFEEEAKRDLLGFYTVWQLAIPQGQQLFSFIEHFAVREETRGLGIGSHISTSWKNKYDNLILEVEPADMNLMAARRIEFYKRIGYQLLDDYPYEQPAYRPGASPLELQLMSSKSFSLNVPISEAVQEIKQSVYSGLENPLSKTTLFETII